MKDQKIKEPSIDYEANYTYADYLTFTFEGMVEVIKGKLYKMSPAPSTSHQLIFGQLFRQISTYLHLKKCLVFSAPFDVILPVRGKDFMQSDRVVQPDLCVICDVNKIQERGCFGAPDWIIEILSPSTAKKDVQDKFDLYEESEVGEYWIVDPLNKTVEVFVLKEKQYHRIRTYVSDDVVSSHTLPELSISLAEVFAKLK